MKVVFLEGVKEDLKEPRRYIIKNFGRSTGQETDQPIKYSVRDILIFPQSGVIPEELVDCSDIRRDMRTLLSRRLLRVIK
ncbi:type II toxin-antitoxin system RelE/ParE family toxin [Mycetohabitans sp. B46]|uniref:type II toxin-antitoxin system RelE/ParE family toxin n=1 Tax=Mycetohabitans sp. B46 TaxID=2772536 RepID=UPI00307E3EC6